MSVSSHNESPEKITRAISGLESTYPNLAKQLTIISVPEFNLINAIMEFLSWTDRPKSDVLKIERELAGIDERCRQAKLVQEIISLQILTSTSAQINAAASLSTQPSTNGTSGTRRSSKVEEYRVVNRHDADGLELTPSMYTTLEEAQAISDTLIPPNGISTSNQVGQIYKKIEHR